jgi:hypothetical protein
MLCAVCTIHKETRSTGFLVEPQNQGRRVSRFGPQIRQLRFRDLCLKTKRVKVCRLRQDLADCIAWKQVRLGFSSLPQN